MPRVRNIQATERPRPHPARPGGVDLAVDQRGDRERERDREADIAEIEQRRMHREPDVLQDRVEVAPLGRRLRDAQERVRGDQDEEIERAGDPGLHGEHVGAQCVRQVSSEQRDQRAEDAQDQHPQQHRAFVIAPHAGELVDERHRRVRILEHVQHREIGADVSRGERAERGRREGELRERGRAGDTHQGRVVRARAPQRHRRLDQRERERQHQRVVAELGDHFFAPGAAASLLFAPARP